MEQARPDTEAPVVKALSTSALLAALAALAAAVPAGAGTAGGQAAAVTTVGVWDAGFTPPTVKIKKNGSVKWVWGAGNADAHNVTLISGPRGVKIFFSRKAASGYSYTRKFRKAGKYVIFCSAHPGNQQTIIVK